MATAWATDRREGLDEALAGVGGSAAGADELDDLVEVVERDPVALQDVRALARLAQLVAGAADDDLAAVADEVGQHLLEGEDARTLVDDGEQDDAERRLQRGVLVQVVEHDLFVGIALELDDDAHALAVGLVAQVRDAVDLLVPGELGDLLDQPGLVHLVGQLVDDDGALAARQILEGGVAADDDPTATGLVGVADTRRAVDGAAGGKVRTRA